MAVVQAVVESLDGGLSLSSKQGKGLLVQMMLPCAQIENRQTTNAESTGSEIMMTGSNQ